MMSNANDARLPLSRLRAIAARYVLGTVDGTALVQAAHALLDAGIYSYSIGELATASMPYLRDIGCLFDSALKELAIPLPSLEEAVQTLLRWHLYGVIEGRVSPRQAMGNLWDELYHPLTFDRRLENLKPERNLIYLWYGYEELHGLAEEDIVSREEAGRQTSEQDIELLERAQSWMYQDGSRLLNPRWLSWNDGIVRKLAQTISEERDWGRLPILADALEEAGCDQVELVEHCRAGERHMERCWVTEMLLLRDIAPSF